MHRALVGRVGSTSRWPTFASQSTRFVVIYDAETRPHTFRTSTTKEAHAILLPLAFTARNSPWVCICRQRFPPALSLLLGPSLMYANWRSCFVSSTIALIHRLESCSFLYFFPVLTPVLRVSVRIRPNTSNSFQTAFVAILLRAIASDSLPSKSAGPLCIELVTFIRDERSLPFASSLFVCALYGSREFCNTQSGSPRVSYENVTSKRTRRTLHPLLFLFL